MLRSDIGLIGLGVMGRNLSLNIESRGYSVAVYDREPDVTERFVSETAVNRRISPAYSFEELVASLSRPRRIVLMIKAGPPVDSVIDQLLPHLDGGDILIDGGNSHYRDTDRRYDRLTALGFSYMGVGISGGEYGALHGPSIMPGGDEETYNSALREILSAIAAQAEDGPCVTYIGPRSAGHYVKMVHNAIEYGVMQVIAEAYDVMRKLLGMSAEEISAGFANWNKEQKSYLMEITAEMLDRVDSETGRPLVDMILDTAGQKGTGKWGVQDALDLGLAVPTIGAAVEARIMSAMKNERMLVSRSFSRVGLRDAGVGAIVGATQGAVEATVKRAAERATEGAAGGVAEEATVSATQRATEREAGSATERGRAALLSDLRDALYLSTVTAYAEGMKVLQAASTEYGYGLRYHEIARIWKAGCIIRSSLLSRIQEAYLEDPDPVSLVTTKQFKEDFKRRATGWRRAVLAAQARGVPVPAMSAALSHFDSLTSPFLPANLVQGQRDCFGAHTYQRVDRDGTFHTDWIEGRQYRPRPCATDGPGRK